MHNVTNSGRSGFARRRLPTSGRARPTWLLGAALVCAALTAGSVFGQQDAARAKAKPGGDTAKGPKARQKDVSRQGSVLTVKQPPRPSSGKRGPAPAKGGPQPRWVCTEPTVTIAPIWPGPMIECVFAIRNEGEGYLNIKANGG